MRKKLFYFLTIFLLIISFSTNAEEGKKKAKVLKFHESTVYEIANGKAKVRMIVTPEKTHENSIYGGIFVGTGGLNVPLHKHDDAIEVLFIILGKAFFFSDGERFELKKGDTVYIPKGVEHSLQIPKNAPPLRAIQLYLPPGPEKRFLQGKKIE